MRKVVPTRRATWVAADIDVIGAGGVTPLHRATSIADKELVQVLLDWNADAAVEDMDGMTPLQCAVDNGYGEIREILQHHQAMQESDRTALQPAMETEEPEATVEPSPKEVDTKDEETRRELLRRFLRLNVRDREVEIGRAASRGDLNSFMVLLNMGVNTEVIDEERYTLLQLASRGGHNAVVKTLLITGADVDKCAYGWTPLLLASQNGHETVVKTLLAANAEIQTAEYQGTALGTATRNGHDSIVETLLAAGANTETLYSRSTALVEAAYYGHHAILDMLLAAGADIEAREARKSPLKWASQRGRSQIVKTLLVAGADIEAARDGKTALQLALHFHHDEVAQMLRPAGARSGASRVAYATLRRLGLKDRVDRPKELE